MTERDQPSPVVPRHRRSAGGAHRARLRALRDALPAAGQPAEGGRTPDEHRTPDDHRLADDSVPGDPATWADTHTRMLPFLRRASLPGQAPNRRPVRLDLRWVAVALVTVAVAAAALAGLHPDRQAEAPVAGPAASPSGVPATTDPPWTVPAPTRSSAAAAGRGAPRSTISRAPAPGRPDRNPERAINPSTIPVGQGPPRSAQPSPTRSAAGRRSAPPSPAPPAGTRARMLGPADNGRLHHLLGRYCRATGARGAALVGPHRGNPGHWSCVRMLRTVRIDMTHACKWRYGHLAHAKLTRPGDQRSWRCFG